ncbi:hypothetical protein [Nocardioides taihuensis]|uniref:Uncharacterized protein n=1 Tax=Nocardioides taihuensis TaxID=1835606 RepID=A0ABW0BK42_9ACTN
MRTLLHVLVALGLLVVGVVTAVAVVALHQLWWGLVLGLAATLTTLVALPPGWWTRLAFAVGWVGLVAYVVPARPSGSYLVPGNAAGYLLLGAGLVVLLLAVATVRPARRDEPDDGLPAP